MINAGISGDTFLDMGRRLDEDVLAHNPKVVILMGGTNDVYVGMSQPQIRQGFLAIMEVLQKKGIEVWLGLPLPVDDSFERKRSVWRNWLRDYGQANNLTVIDFYQDFITEEGKIRDDLLVDECHPRVIGYQVMGQRILKAVFHT